MNFEDYDQLIRASLDYLLPGLFGDLQRSNRGRKNTNSPTETIDFYYLILFNQRRLKISSQKHNIYATGFNLKLIMFSPKFIATTRVFKSY